MRISPRWEKSNSPFRNASQQSSADPDPGPGPAPDAVEALEVERYSASASMAHGAERRGYHSV